MSANPSIPSKILPLFEALKISPAKYNSKINNIKLSQNALNPLLLPTTATSFSSPSQSDFIFEQYQYTSLGNAVIQRAISTEVVKFMMKRNTPASASPNTTKQLIAVFHNSLSVRFVAESLPLAPSVDVMSSTVHAATDDGGENENENTSSNKILLNLDEIFASSSPSSSSPSRADKKGTSFDWSPFGFSQSDLAPRLTHFLGCIELFCGREEALSAARRAFFDLDGEVSNLPFEAAQVLATLSKRYNAQNVAKALLAAQGLNCRFLSRSIIISGGHRKKQQQRQHETVGKKSSSSTSFNAAADEEVFAAMEKQEEQEPETKSTEKKKDGVQTTNDAKNNFVATKDNSSTTTAIPKSSHAMGPGKLNMISKWQNRVMNNIKQQEHKNLPLDTEILFGGSGFQQENNKTASMWPDRNSETAPIVETNADRHGIPDILEQQQRVSKPTVPGKPVADPTFFDRDEGKEGVEISTSELSAVVGMNLIQQKQQNQNSAADAALVDQTKNVKPLSTRSIVNSLSQPHDRLFEVSFLRDPIISSTTLRREVYATDVPRDAGKGKSIPDLTRGHLFGDDHSSSLSENSHLLKEKKVGPKLLSKGVGKSYGEARRAAAMNYLQAVISDLSVM